jgi:hypothetical protein
MIAAFETGGIDVHVGTSRTIDRLASSHSAIIFRL